MSLISQIWAESEWSKGEWYVAMIKCETQLLRERIL
jgi:hypothetical protein